MSDDEVERLRKEAEQYAAEDAKRKQEVENRNKAETLVYETEKSLKELEGKIDDAEKKDVEEAKEDLKKALEANNQEDIKAKTDVLTEKFHKIAEKLYQQQGAAGAGPDMSGMAGASGGAGTSGTDAAESGAQADNVVDADFEVVDEDKDKK